MFIQHATRMRHIVTLFVALLVAAILCRYLYMTVL